MYSILLAHYFPFYSFKAASSFLSRHTVDSGGRGTVRCRSNRAAGTSRLPLLVRFNATRVLTLHCSAEDANFYVKKFHPSSANRLASVTLSPTAIM